MPNERYSWRHSLPVALMLLWLAGAGLRLTILAVPPVLAMIRDDFGLSATEVGLLSSIPPALFAIASLAGSLLVARLGVTTALVGGLVLVATGSALRGLSTDFAILFATTIVMSAGIAIMQPIMPAAVRQWVPTRIGLGTAIYTNGLLVAEIFPVLLTIPYVLPWVGGDWRMSLVAWSAPIAVIAVAIYAGAPRGGAHRQLAGGGAATVAAGLAQIAGLAPGRLVLLHQRDLLQRQRLHPDLPDQRGPAGSDQRRADRAQFRAAARVVAAARLCRQARAQGLALSRIGHALADLDRGAGADGRTGDDRLGGAARLFRRRRAYRRLTLPALLCPPEDVARTSAGTFTISYGGAVAIAVVSGAAWDLSGIPALAFVPLAICGVALAAIALRMRARRELH